MAPGRVLTEGRRSVSGQVARKRGLVRQWVWCDWCHVENAYMAAMFVRYLPRFVMPARDQPFKTVIAHRMS